MDRIDRAFAKVMQNPRAASKARHYGMARLRSRIRQHMAAREQTFVQIADHEPPYIRAVIEAVVIAWQFDGLRLHRHWPLTYREEVALFGHPNQRPPKAAPWKAPTLSDHAGG